LITGQGRDTGASGLDGGIGVGATGQHDRPHSPAIIRAVHGEVLIAGHPISSDVTGCIEKLGIAHGMMVLSDWRGQRAVLTVNSKMSKFRGSPAALTAYSGLSGSETMKGTISS